MNVWLSKRAKLKQLRREINISQSRQLNRNEGNQNFQKVQTKSFYFHFSKNFEKTIQNIWQQENLLDKNLARPFKENVSSFRKKNIYCIAIEQLI